MGQGQVSPSPQLSSLPLPVSWRASPRRHEPGAGRSDGQAWHLNPCPPVALGGLCGGGGGVQRGPSEHRERKKRVRTEAHPINPLSLAAHALPSHPPLLPPAEILSVSVRRGPHCAWACHWRKGPFGGKQFSCPLWSQWGHIPLLWASVSSRYWSPRRTPALTIHTRWATKSLNLLPHYHLLSASPPFIIPYSDQYCWLHCSVPQKTSWIASCWLFSRITCLLNCVQCGGQLYELIKACMGKRMLSCQMQGSRSFLWGPHAQSVATYRPLVVVQDNSFLLVNSCTAATVRFLLSMWTCSGWGSIHLLR